MGLGYRWPTAMPSSPIMFEHKCKSAPMARGGYLVEEVSNNMVQRAMPYFCQGDVVLACHVDSPSKDVLRNPPPFVSPQNTSPSSLLRHSKILLIGRQGYPVLHAAVWQRRMHFLLSSGASVPTSAQRSGEPKADGSCQVHPFSSHYLPLSLTILY